MKLDVIVGLGEQFPEYMEDSEQVLDLCRSMLFRLSQLPPEVGRVVLTNREEIIVALCFLHEKGECEITYRVWSRHNWHTVQVDIKGHTVEPWPDGSNSIRFDIAFNHK